MTLDTSIPGIGIYVWYSLEVCNMYSNMISQNYMASSFETHYRHWIQQRSSSEISVWFSIDSSFHPVPIHCSQVLESVTHSASCQTMPHMVFSHLVPEQVPDCEHSLHVTRLHPKANLVASSPVALRVPNRVRFGYTFQQLHFAMTNTV